jgi:hypothetical protein
MAERSTYEPCRSAERTSSRRCSTSPFLAKPPPSCCWRRPRASLPTSTVKAHVSVVRPHRSHARPQWLSVVHELALN